MSARKSATVLAAIAVVFLLAACAPRPYALRFEPNGAPMTEPSAKQLAAATDISSLASVSTTDAPALRDTALKELRTRGTLGVRAADLLTTGFPEHTASVPVLVRVCTVNGTASIVVVEAFGDAGKTLTHRRLWVFDRATGAVTLAASFS